MDFVQLSTDQTPFLLATDGAMIDEDFMVVPASLEEPVAASTQLDEFLLEGNFEGVTGTILNVDNFVDQSHFCVSDGGGSGRQFLTHAFGSDQKLPSLYFADEANSHSLTADQPRVINVEEQFDFGIDVDFTGQGVDQFDQGADAAVNPNETIGQRQCNELDDPRAVWLAENADLEFIEKMASENEQQCHLLDELLRDADAFEYSQPSNEHGDSELDQTDDNSSSSMEASEFLNEIYREVQQLEFANAEDVDSVHGSTQTVAAPVAYPTPRRLAPSKTQSARARSFDHDFGSLADHNFGATRRGRPRGSVSKRTGRRDVVLKANKRYQNREAALRYRLKKRAEKFEKEGELEQLEKRNQFLKNEKYSLTAEVEYLRDLLLEIRKLKSQ